MSDITAKIAKLLALADDASNPHEAATAMTRAQELITRYSISQEQIAAAEAQRNGARVNEPIVSRIVYTMRASHRVTWIEWICSTVAECNQAAARPVWDGERRAQRFYATASTLDVLAVLVPSIVGQIEALRDRWSKATGNTGRTERDQYCRGAASTVSQRLRAAVKATRTAVLEEAKQPAATFALPAAGGNAVASQPAPATTALAVVSALAELDKQARDAVIAMNVAMGRSPKRKPYTTSRDPVKDTAARDAGRRDGHKVNLARAAAIGSGK